MSDTSRELERRIDELIKWGVISEVDEDARLCRVSFGERVSAWSPWYMLRCGKDQNHWPPDLHEQALFLSPYGDGSEGVALVGIPSNRFPKPAEAGKDRHVTEYEDGTRFLVDRKKHIVEWKDSFGSAITMKDGYIDLLPAIKVRVKQGGKGRTGLYMPDGTFRAIEPASEEE